MSEREFEELSAGAALNAVPEAERRALDEAVSQHPDRAERVAADADTAAALAELAPPVSPPAALRAALLARIADTPQETRDPFLTDDDFAAAGPAPTEAVDGAARDLPAPARTPARGGIGRRWFALAASIVLLAALGFGAVLVGQQLNRPAAVVALEQIENAPDARSAAVALENGGEATAHWSTTTGQAVLVSDGLPQVASGETFELWFVRDGGAVSAGTFDASDGEATALLAGDLQPGDVIAVTVEASGGSQSGAPTSDPIVAIPTA